MAISTFVALLGLFLGSFIYTTSLRLQSGESLLNRSHCNSCSARVSLIGLIPVLGYLIQKGRCPSCSGKISSAYPLTEIANSVLVLSIYFKTGLSVELIHAIVIFEILVVIAIIDFRTYLIFPQPIILGLAVQTAWLVYVSQSFPLSNVVGLLIGAGVFHWISYLYQVTRRKVGLGAGDATLLGLIGFVFGWEILLSTVFWAAAFGIVGGGVILLANRQSLAKEVAFGPWLVMAVYCCWRFPSFFMSFPIKTALYKSIF